MAVASRRAVTLRMERSHAVASECVALGEGGRVQRWNPLEVGGLVTSPSQRGKRLITSFPADGRPSPRRPCEPSSQAARISPLHGPVPLCLGGRVRD